MHARGELERPRRAVVHRLALDGDLGVLGLGQELHRAGRAHGRRLRPRLGHLGRPVAAARRVERHAGRGEADGDQADDQDPRLAARLPCDDRGADRGRRGRRPARAVAHRGEQPPLVEIDVGAGAGLGRIERPRARRLVAGRVGSAGTAGSSEGRSRGATEVARTARRRRQRGQVAHRLRRRRDAGEHRARIALGGGLGHRRRGGRRARAERRRRRALRPRARRRRGALRPRARRQAGRGDPRRHRRRRRDAELGGALRGGIRRGAGDHRGGRRRRRARARARGHPVEVRVRRREVVVGGPAADQVLVGDVGDVVEHDRAAASCSASPPPHARSTAASSSSRRRAAAASARAASRRRPGPRAAGCR